MPEPSACQLPERTSSIRESPDSLQLTVSGMLTSDYRFYLSLTIFPEVLIKTQNGYFNRLKCILCNQKCTLC